MVSLAAAPGILRLFRVPLSAVPTEPPVHHMRRGRFRGQFLPAWSARAVTRVQSSPREAPPLTSQTWTPITSPGS